MSRHSDATGAGGWRLRGQPTDQIISPILLRTIDLIHSRQPSERNPVKPNPGWCSPHGSRYSRAGPRARREHPAAARRAQDTISAKALSSTPQQALARFAQLYVNWNASTVRAHQLALAAISVGAARLTSEQAAAHIQGDAAVGQDSISNSGQVVSIARGVGSAAGSWVIVTRERTRGARGYGNLPAQLHVTYAQVTVAGGGWVISSWQPQN